MRTGYPRFYIHDCIRQFTQTLLGVYGVGDEKAMLFPTRSVASRCADFLQSQMPCMQRHQVRLVDLNLEIKPQANDTTGPQSLALCLVILPEGAAQSAKEFWQHTGEGISSRQADFCHACFKKQLSRDSPANGRAQHSHRGPRRYQRKSSADATQSNIRPRSSRQADDAIAEGEDCSVHIEERYGRNLDLSLASTAKVLIRRRIAGLLTANAEPEKAKEMPGNLQTSRIRKGFSDDDVYLFPTGMSSIFNTHRILMALRGPMKSICFGFPYIDTLKVLEKWGPGCLFYGRGSADDLDDLERRLERGERYLALFCEFPSNPLLKSPDLQQIRLLSKKYDFAVVVDETVGNLLNVHVLSYADVAVSSLTKVFSGDSNVMGGSAVLNPNSAYYKELKVALEVEYEDNYWAEDAVFMERNSRSFVSRIQEINSNAEAICDVLRTDDLVKEVHYPKFSPTRQFYDHCRNEDGGYGGLLSVVFHTTEDAVMFFDCLETAKGPSLGTNFTLICPYTLLAHYQELDWAASFGIKPDLIRISVGREEDSKDLVKKFQQALATVRRFHNIYVGGGGSGPPPLTVHSPKTRQQRVDTTTTSLAQ